MVRQPGIPCDGPGCNYMQNKYNEYRWLSLGSVNMGYYHPTHRDPSNVNANKNFHSVLCLLRWARQCIDYRREERKRTGTTSDQRTREQEGAVAGHHPVQLDSRTD